MGSGAREGQVWGPWEPRTAHVNIPLASDSSLTPALPVPCPALRLGVLRVPVGPDRANPSHCRGVPWPRYLAAHTAGGPAGEPRAPSSRRGLPVRSRGLLLRLTVCGKWDRGHSGASWRPLSPGPPPPRLQPQTMGLTPAPVPGVRPGTAISPPTSGDWGDRKSLWGASCPPAQSRAGPACWREQCSWRTWPHAGGSACGRLGKPPVTEPLGPPFWVPPTL